MSSQTGPSQSDLFFCHQCENEWRGSANELRCPRCTSEFVELVENNDDPRDERNAPDPPEAHPDTTPHHPLHHINPWAQDRPSLDEGNVEHVEWNPSPGLHFSRTSYRSTSPRGGFPPQPSNDAFTSLFQNLFEQPAGPRRSSPFPPPFSAPPHQAPWRQGYPQFPEPLRNRPGYGGGNTYTSTTRVWPAPSSPTNTGNNHLQEVMQALFQNIAQASDPNANTPNGGPATNGFGGLHQLLASFINPANAAHGDVVYTEEALDRIISQFMESQNGSSAPGPASEAAIEALPKKKVDQDMLGSDGKAECSVCMDNVQLNDEVTVLPCQHWFHGECVGAWLKEHDTCPHCRQGIMPKDVPPNEAASARSPNQEPRTSLPPLDQAGNTMPGGFHFRYQSSGGNGDSPTASFRSRRELQVPSPRAERRRSSGSSGRNPGEGSGGGGISSAIGGWMRNHLGGGGGNQDRSSGR